MDEHGDLIIVDLPNYKMVIFQFANHQDSPAMFASPGQRFFRGGDPPVPPQVLSHPSAGRTSTAWRSTTDEAT